MTWQYRVVLYGIVVTIFIAIGWYEGSSHVQDEWDKDKAIQVKAALDMESDYREKEQRLQQQLSEAQNEAVEREKKIVSDNAASTAATRSLRDTISSLRSQLPSTSPQACVDTADTFLDVLGECTERYREVAEDADRHANDAKTLSEAWPQQ